MRITLNAILAFIGQASLSDDEFGALTIEDTLDDNLTYLDLVDVLESRESVSTALDRLRFYFLAKGATLSSIDEANSNILMGGGLCR